MFLSHIIPDSGVWYLLLVPLAHLGYVFLGGLLLLLFGRTRRQVGFGLRRG